MLRKSRLKINQLLHKRNLWSKQNRKQLPNKLNNLDLLQKIAIATF